MDGSQFFRRLGAGFGKTWEDNRDAEPASFPEAWGQTTIRWKVRPDISLRERLDAFAETRDESNYWCRSNTGLEFRFGEHFALETGGVYKWDHQPARNAGRSSWITRTRFVFS
jgi:putative salt-induced outer membrane protein YdiY